MNMLSKKEEPYLLRELFLQGIFTQLQLSSIIEFYVVQLLVIMLLHYITRYNVIWGHLITVPLHKWNPD